MLKGTVGEIEQVLPRLADGFLLTNTQGIPTGGPEILLSGRSDGEPVEQLIRGQPLVEPSPLFVKPRVQLGRGPAEPLHGLIVVASVEASPNLALAGQELDQIGRNSPPDVPAGAPLHQPRMVSHIQPLRNSRRSSH
jgi:hypothetical protein